MNEPSPPPDDFVFPTAEAVAHHPEDFQPAPPLPEPLAPTEEAIDHGVEETFPASDPVSVSTDKA